LAQNLCLLFRIKAGLHLTSSVKFPVTSIIRLCPKWKIKEVIGIIGDEAVPHISFIFIVVVVLIVLVDFCFNIQELVSTLSSVALSAVTLIVNQPKQAQ
jgi:hypothetical protein